MAKIFFIQEWEEKEILGLVYTSRQVNSVPERPQPFFTLVIVCDVEQIPESLSAMKKCFDHSDVGYYYDQSTPDTAGMLSCYLTSDFIFPVERECIVYGLLRNIYIYIYIVHYFHYIIVFLFVCRKQ